jgi:hypothetical protein
MEADDVKRYLCTAFDGVNPLESPNGDTFLLYDPGRDLPPERQMPFATIVTGDHYDTVSALDRPGAYRLNLGLTKATYTALFGAAPTRRDEQGMLDTGFDYAAVDTLMPHPIYASQYWVSIVNPGEANWPRVRDLLAEAHGFAARKYANQQARQAAHRDAPR